MFDAVKNTLEWIPLGLPAFILVITVVVFFHELGHFSMARAFGVRVETFSLGFGREIVGWTDRRGTRWKIGWLPVGGYVKFLGDADAASRPDRDAATGMSPAERAQSLPFKPLYQRALIVAAGPFANFILAIVVFTLIFMCFGRTVVPPLIGAVVPGGAAQQAGIRAGDLIRAIDGTPINDFAQMPAMIVVGGGQELEITLERAGQPIIVHATPRMILRPDVLGDMAKTPTLGIQSSTAVKPVFLRYGPIDAVGQACSETWNIITGSLAGIKQMVLGRSDASQMMGTLGIARVSRKVASAGIFPLINLIALISVSLGLVNLFPIPVLDGGHLLYYGCEAVLGHPLGERAQEAGFRLGLVLVLGLMIFSVWNDLVHHLNLF